MANRRGGSSSLPSAVWIVVGSPPVVVDVGGLCVQVLEVVDVEVEETAAATRQVERHTRRVVQARHGAESQIVGTRLKDSIVGVGVEKLIELVLGKRRKTTCLKLIVLEAFGSVGEQLLGLFSKQLV